MEDGKTYSGGVIIATPFKMEDNQPIVDYLVVDDIAGRDSLPNQFDGMDTYVKETKKKYYKSEGEWKEFDSGETIEDHDYRQIVIDTILF